MGRHAGQAEAEREDVATITDYVLEPPEGEEEVADFSPVVVAEIKAPFKTMTVAAAVTELDLSGAPVLVFRHSGNAHVNIVYRRGDGHIGWIDPSSITEA